MSTRQIKERPPPLIRPRDLVRIMTLLVFMAFIMYAMIRANNPRTWDWVRVFATRPAATEPVVNEEPGDSSSLRNPVPITTQSYVCRTTGLLAQFTQPTWTPASVCAGVAGALGEEFILLPSQDPRANDAESRRKAPVPLRELLAGAIDRERFLLENPDGPINPLHREDADARYHLLELARDASLEHLAADSRKDVRYSGLMEKTTLYRGELIHIRGDLKWVKHFELHRQVPGLDFAYEGVIEVGGPDRSYWILMTELPPNFSPEREWSRLYLRNVQFDGYFLKVLKVMRPEGSNAKTAASYLPVLIGKTVQLPVHVAQSPWDAVPWRWLIGGLAVAATLAIIITVVYRRQDRIYQARLAAARARHREQGGAGGLTSSGSAGPENPFDADGPASPSRGAGAEVEEPTNRNGRVGEEH